MKGFGVREEKLYEPKQKIFFFSKVEQWDNGCLGAKGLSYYRVELTAGGGMGSWLLFCFVTRLFTCLLGKFRRGFVAIWRSTQTSLGLNITKFSPFYKRGGGMKPRENKISKFMSLMMY